MENAANINVGIVSIHTQKKQSGNENNKNDYCRVNPNETIETNKSEKENTI